jgi:hypothetical protein
MRPLAETALACPPWRRISETGLPRTNNGKARLTTQAPFNTARVFVERAHAWRI